MRKPVLWWAAMAYASLLGGLGFRHVLFDDFWLGLAAVGFALFLASIADAAYRKGQI